VENRGNLVKGEEIIQWLWGGDVYFDAERGINNAIRKIRAALHDESGQPQFVETIVGKGYRFVAPVNPESTIAVVATSSVSTSSVATALAPEMPSAAESVRPSSHSLSARSSRLL